MTKLGEVCSHGGLRRCCETCDLADDLQKANNELERVRAALDEAVRVIDGLRYHTSEDPCWCELAIGNPMFSTHSPCCQDTRSFLASLKDAGTKGAVG